MLQISLFLFRNWWIVSISDSWDLKELMWCQMLDVPNEIWMSAGNFHTNFDGFFAWKQNIEYWKGFCFQCVHVSSHKFTMTCLLFFFVESSLLPFNYSQWMQSFQCDEVRFAGEKLIQNFFLMVLPSSLYSACIFLACRSTDVDLSKVNICFQNSMS